MKRILIVTDAYAPQVNGVVRVQDAYRPLLRARGYDVRIIEPGQFKTIPLPLYPEIPVALFPGAHIGRIVDEYKPDAIHLMTEGALGWSARAVCRARGIPFTSWYHTHFQLYVDVRLRGLFTPVQSLLRHFHSAAVHTIVSTNTLKKALEAMGFKKNITVVPLGVDTDLFKRNPAPSLPPLPGPVFIYLSRLAPEKSPEEFLALDLPGTKLVVGDGPDRKKLEEKYGAKNLFVGYKHGKELVDCLSLADVLIFPSRTETFGLVALEALSCGVPVAAHDLMGPRDAITVGKDGYLDDNLREAALKCLDLKREDCRTKALQYSWDRSVDTFLQNLTFR